MTREEAINKIRQMRLPKETMEILEALAPELAESDDERIRRALINALKVSETIGELEFRLSEPTKEKAIAYLEKQKEASKAIEAVERIDKYIDEHVENAHDMKDSHPDKKYCQGIDDTLAGIAGILQDVYSNEKQKEQNDEECTDFVIYCPIKNGEGEYECIPYSFYGSLTSFSEDKDLIDFLRTCFYTEEECNEWIKRQKEQKPGEYLDKDKIYAIMKKLNDLSFSKDILINSKEYKQIDEITLRKPRRMRKNYKVQLLPKNGLRKSSLSIMSIQLSQSGARRMRKCLKPSCTNWKCATY